MLIIFMIFLFYVWSLIYYIFIFFWKSDEILVNKKYYIYNIFFELLVLILRTLLFFILNKHLFKDYFSVVIQ